MAPLAPTNVTATAGLNSATVSWVAAATATQYRVYSSSDAYVAVLATVGNVTTATITGLASGAVLTFEVDAGDAVPAFSPKSAPSAAVTILTPAAYTQPDGLPPTAPASAGDKFTAPGYVYPDYNFSPTADGSPVPPSVKATAAQIALATAQSGIDGSGPQGMTGHPIHYTPIIPGVTSYNTYNN
jgi:hypothetical protein